jgi:dTMP kinase
MPVRGRFITLEGSEGVGKSTNLAVIAETLQGLGINCVSTREPGGTPLAEEIRQLLLAVRVEAVAPTAELLLMFAARAQHLSALIEPSLAKGLWVVSDRFTDATFAYQGGGRGMDVAVIEQLERLVQGNLRPDLTLYLDLDPEIAAQRLGGRDRDRFELESRPFFERVRGAYLQRASGSDRYRIIDASQPLEVVRANVRSLVEQFVRLVQRSASSGPKSSP